MVNLQYEGGATVSFSMVGFTERVCERQIRVFGTRGEISCDMGEMRVRHVDFTDGQGCEYTLQCTASHSQHQLAAQLVLT